MPYYVYKSGKNWDLKFQQGKLNRYHVPKDSNEAKLAGFNSEMTYLEAYERAKQLQAETWIEEQARKEKKSRDVIEKYQKLKIAYLNHGEVQEFERIYLPEKKIRQPHWHTMKSIIINVGIHPSQWYKQSSLLYQEFIRRKYSPNYIKKLLRYLNIWGYFVCEKHNKAWKDVEFPAGSWKRKIADTYESRIKRASFESDPISFELLNDVRTKIKKEHYNWIFISIAFGLRPREVDNLKSLNANLWRIEKNKNFGYVLHIFQEKLYERGVSKEKAWKYIPCIMNEQIEAIELIKSKAFKKPIGAGAKGFRSIFGYGFTAYGGRKNFVDMLRNQGYDLETVSKWAGHLTVKTTEQSYSRNIGVFYRPPVNLKRAS